ncbi:polysaccharide biosynthesis tyrosine autokinase [Micromonospora sp. NPDC049679]|uniref:polysaccharide biosynthesis tyrosine autokinase n=1 Tax=Micromonospora sp. NPDC049679 TaxID=3155920 RepID=UPI0033C1BBE7
MEFRNHLVAVRQRWWLVLTAVALALGIAGFVTMRAEPKYATTVTFFVTTPNQGVSDAYQGGLFLQQRVKSYVDLLTSDRLARTVVESRNLGLTTDEAQSRITSRVQADTVLLEASVVDEDRGRSMELAKAVSARFIELVQKIETPPGADRSAVKVEIVGGPRLDPQPVSPRPVRDLSIAGVLGLLVGVGLAALRGMTDTTVRDQAALGRAAETPLLGLVPFENVAKSSPLVVGDAAHSPRAEAIRKLRTNLRFVNVGETVQVLAVTSAMQGEGKSTMACNLSITLAEAGWRVLLVDADLRRPHVADYMGMESGVGLTDVLIGEVAVEDVLQPWGDLSLSVLPSGSLPPNPSELLGSKTMFDLLTTLKQHADIVVVDTAPLLSITDGAVIAAQCDGALLVTRRGKTSTSQVTAAATALRAAGARLLGSVLNMSAMPKADAYQYAAYKVPTTPTTPMRPRVPAKTRQAVAPAQNTGPGDGRHGRVKKLSKTGR